MTGTFQPCDARTGVNRVLKPIIYRRMDEMYLSVILKQLDIKAEATSLAGELEDCAIGVVDK
jgi:hypothetical protein